MATRPVGPLIERAYNSFTFFRLSRNHFEGSIPDTMKGWKNIQEVCLHGNHITGTIEPSSAS